MQRNAKRLAVFHPEFRDDLLFWVKTERSAAIRVLDLVEAVIRDAFEGSGKLSAGSLSLLNSRTRSIGGNAPI